MPTDPTPDLLALLDTLDGLHKDASPGEWRYSADKCWRPGKHGAEPITTPQEAVFGDGVRPCLALTGEADDPQSIADGRWIAAAKNAYPRLAQALRTALTPTTDGEREAREALARCDAANFGGQLVNVDHLRTALALLAAERAEHAMLRASLTVPERYVGVVTEALTEEVEQLRAKAADAAREREAWVCDCGLPMSRNPHPDAGKPTALLDVGAVWVCIPCTVKSRHGATTARFQAERDRDEAQAQERIRCAQAMQDTAATVTGADPYYVGVRTALESFARGLLAEVTP